MKVTNEGDIVSRSNQKSHLPHITSHELFNSVSHTTLYQECVSAAHRPAVPAITEKPLIYSQSESSARVSSPVRQSSAFSHLRSSDLVSFICFWAAGHCPGFHLSAIFYMHLRLFVWITVQKCLEHAISVIKIIHFYH